MLDSFVNTKYDTFKEQSVLYLIGILFLLMSSCNLPVESQVFYQYACVCYLGFSPYYLTIKGR